MTRTVESAGGGSWGAVNAANWLAALSQAGYPAKADLAKINWVMSKVILTIMVAAEKLDPSLEEAARALGAGPWRVIRDVVLPALTPAFIASGAIAFATAMGAFGTAFTLATDIDVLPMLIYTEFTLSANFAISAALSVGLGLITWAILALARTFGGNTVAAAG